MGLVLDTMDIWILRYPEPRRHPSEPRRLIVLHRSNEGAESELEVLEVEMRSSPLSRAVRDQIQNRRPRVVLDLIHEKRMDSMDLAQTLEAFKQAGEAGGELVIANPNSRIREIFRITHLDEVVALFDSIEAAVEHFRSQSSG